MLYSLHASTRVAGLAVKRVASMVLFFGGLGLLATAASAAPSVWITRVSAPAAGTYDRSMALHFTVNFSAPVQVQGAPRLTLRVGDAWRHATFVTPLALSPDGVTSLTFEYAPAATDLDEDGVAIAGALDLNGGAIVGRDRSPAALTFATPDTREVRIATLRPPSPQILAANAGGKDGDVLVLRGTADGSSRVFVHRADRGVMGSTLAAPNGAWSYECDRAQIGAGLYQFAASIEDTRGLLSAASPPFAVNVSKRGDEAAARPDLER